MQPIKKTIFLIIAMLLPVSAFAVNVEIYLLDKLDGNLNHYCIDMRGFQERADIKENLQTHTCYSYQGQLAMDQVIDTAAIEKGSLNLHEFGVCAQINGTAAGSSIGLAECSEADTQKFELKENGHIVPAAAASMCLTAGPASWRGGRNGDSPHQVRTLDLQPCSDEASAYQRWGTREEM